MARTRWLLGLVLVIQFLALYLPGSTIQGPTLLPPGSDKVIHFLLFAAPAFLLRRVTPRWWPIWLLALHAPISELVQWAWVPNRSGELLDVVADLLGVGVGCLLAAAGRKR